MCTGEVDRKVWMRRRLAGLIASAQRSMSLSAARDSPQITAFLARLAISLHGGEIAFRGDREAGLDDVDAHGVEQLGDLELLLVGHGGARALLAVAQRRVEDDDAVLVGLGRGGHGLSPSPRMRRFKALYGVLIPKVPRVPRRICPAGPQGRIRRRSVPRMRVAAGSALPAARSIAQICCRVVIASEPSSSPAKVAELGKVHVN